MLNESAHSRIKRAIERIRNGKIVRKSSLRGAKLVRLHASENIHKDIGLRKGRVDRMAKSVRSLLRITRKIIIFPIGYRK